MDRLYQAQQEARILPLTDKACSWTAGHKHASDTTSLNPSMIRHLCSTKGRWQNTPQAWIHFYEFYPLSIRVMDPAHLPVSASPADLYLDSQNLIPFHPIISPPFTEPCGPPCKPPWG
jgi:hypothetical protein